MRILLLLIQIFLLGGCASPPPAPLSDVEKSLYTVDPNKASVVIYRSTEESWLDKPIPAYIYIDGYPFIRLLGGEYVQIHLTDGPHEINVKYSRDCELSAPEAVQILVSDPDHILYLEIVPDIGRMTWIYCSPLQGVPFPMPMLGSKVKLVLKDEEDARKYMGKSVDAELLKIRRITR